MSCQSRFGKTSSTSNSSSSSSNGGGGGGGGASAADAARAAAAAAAAEAARKAAVRANAVKITASIGKGTLSLHSIAVAASPSAKINLGRSTLNAIYAGAAGLTTAAVCVVTGGCFTNPGIVYLPRHKQAGECVASGAYAALGQANYTPPPRPNLDFSLPGLESLPGRNRARGHLVGFAMKGSNTDTRNFVPMYQKANVWMFINAEEPVVNAIKKGGNVYVESYPIYGNRKSTVPTAIEYFTTGSVQEECVIQNNATATGSYCQRGMW